MQKINTTAECMRVLGWKFRTRLVAIAVLAFTSFHLPAQEPSKESLDRQYQAAVADFNDGRFSQAAAKLEPLLPYATRSFEVHELIGLAYASSGEKAKAEEHLKLAVQIAPNSAAARTNFGTLLVHSGKFSLAVEQLTRALQLEPESYDANHNLGELYARTGKVAEAQPLLEKAQTLNAQSYENGYDLALADYTLGKLDEASSLAHKLLESQNSADVHNLLAHINEKQEHFVEAASEYELAAHLDPSEENLFDWGSEMLLHRTYDPATTIFRTATERYPKSPQFFIGLGLALYFRGQYDDAVKALLHAIDLNPKDPRPYVFLSRAYDSSPTLAGEVTERFRQFAALQPNDARAQYYYAISLWKGKRAGAASADTHEVESLLLKSVRLDDRFPQAHVQLGDLYASQHGYEKAIQQYERAVALDPALSDAHYRLGTNYVHVGRKDDAQKQFALYQTLRAQQLAERDKEHAEVQQFVYSEQPASAAKP